MAVLKALLVAAAIIATTQLAAAQTAAERREALSRSIPKHEGYWAPSRPTTSTRSARRRPSI